MAPEQAPEEKPTQVIEPFAIGSLLGNRYRIANQIGKGGFGVVYLAYDEKLHRRPVVVKVLDEKSGVDEWRQAKFHKESEALARIDNPGIVGVLDQGTTPENKLFIVLQFVDGVTLRSAMKAPMDLARAANLISQTADALTVAHDHGVCHRDLKPENIMLRSLAGGREQVVVIDFGIATVTDSSVTQTGESKVAGSPLYMAPEQWLGKPETASDIFSLGVIAYELVTGQLPFHGNSAVELYFQQQQGVQQKPCALRPELSAGAENAILKALTFDPKQRYARALDFGNDFAESLLEEPAAPTVTPPVPPVTPPSDPSEGVDPELAFVLFMDVVGYSQLPTDRQIPLIHELNDVVRGTLSYRKAQARQDLISLSTGDGVALVFFKDPLAPVECAVEMARALKAHPEVRLRMGVNSGPVYRMADINEKRNVGGSGINMAQRVMDCGDNGHILVSGSVADVLKQLSEWSSWLHDCGEYEVKHGVRLRIYNIYKHDVGNPARPRKKTPSVWRYVAIAALVAALIIGIWWVTHPPNTAKKQTAPAGPPPVTNPTTPARTLTYSFAVRKPHSQEWIPYSREMIAPANYSLRFFFSSPQSGRLYLLNEGPTPHNNMASFNVLGAISLNANQVLQFPAGEPIVLDRQQGVEKLYVIWSSQAIQELEALQKWGNPKDIGAVNSAADVARIQLFLQNNSPNAKVEEQERRTVLNQSADPLVYMIKLQHL